MYAYQFVFFITLSNELKKKIFNSMFLSCLKQKVSVSFRVLHFDANVGPGGGGAKSRMCPPYLLLRQKRKKYMTQSYDKSPFTDINFTKAE